MPAETFYCPHCRSQLTKSAQAYVLGEASDFVAMGGMAETVTCPRCGGAIDAMKMIRGDYDQSITTLQGLAALATGAAVFALAVFALDFAWWVGAIGGVVSIGLAVGAIETFGRRRT